MKDNEKKGEAEKRKTLRKRKNAKTSVMKEQNI
jgi:hypothetical protein